MHWGEPGWLILLALVPLPWLAARARPRVAWPSLRGFGPSPTAAGACVARDGADRCSAAWRSWCMAVALCGRRRSAGRTRIAGRGVAIVVALDNSSSMTTVDFPADHAPLSRLDAARATLARFVAGTARRSDRPGGVRQLPRPRLPADARPRAPARLRAGRPPGPARRRRHQPRRRDRLVARRPAARSPPKKKVLILLTDGRNSPAVPHPLDPEKAAALARDLGVTPPHDRRGQEARPRRAGPAAGGRPDRRPDLALLERLAQLGGGRAFVATDATPSTSSSATSTPWRRAPFAATIRTRYRERYAPWVALALALLALDRILSAGRLRRLP